MANPQRKLKLILTRPDEPPGKVVHDARGTAIWAGELSLELADGLTLLDDTPQPAPSWDPYDRAAPPHTPEKTSRR